jgi:glycosyltransferase involved in cell wall biosynthesis
MSSPPTQRAAELRVAHVISTPSGVGGAERMLSDLLSHATHPRQTTTVLNPFALDPDDPAARELYAPASYEACRGASWRELPALRRWLANRLERFDPDIVHAHLFHASVLVASLPRPGHARLVLSHQHGDHFHASGARLGELLDRVAGRRFDHVVGCSQSVEDYLLYRYGYPPGRVSHVHNGWSGEPHERRPDPGRHDVICVARLRAQKNHATLIDAHARVRAQVPDARLLLAGDGAEREAIRAHTRRLGLDGSVELLGSVDDVWPLLARAHVFVLPSLYEPLGIAVLEAMAAGLPVVASSVGGLREIVEDDVTGYLVPAGDAGALADRVTRLLQDPKLATQMGERGRQAAANYRVERSVERYERLYERLRSEPIERGPARLRSVTRRCGGPRRR